MTISLREIKQRCEKASPEPWEFDGGRHSVTLTASNGITIFHTGEYPGPGKTDAAFIATARTDVPALVAWIEKAIDAMTPYIKGECRCLAHEFDHPAYRCQYCAKINELLFEVTR